MRIDKPIIFSGPMVRALLDGRKTQTRRLAWGSPTGITSDRILEYGSRGYFVSAPNDEDDGPEHYAYPPSPWHKLHDRWQAGERDIWLWVRETFTTWEREIQRAGEYYFTRETDAMYAADFEGFNRPERDWSWTPSIHMPRWASRLSLEVTGMKIERLQDISEADARAEGCECPDCKDRGWILDQPFAPRPVAAQCPACLELARQHGVKPDPGNFVHIKALGRFQLLWNSIHGEGAWEKNPEVVAMTFRVHRRNIDDIARAA